MPRYATVQEMQLLRLMLVNVVFTPAAGKRTRMECRHCKFFIITTRAGVGSDAMIDHLEKDHKKCLPARMPQPQF